jgi:hypothetical protein
MIRVSVLALCGLAFAGCDLGGDPSSSSAIPARAAASAERLPKRVQEAAQALVRLETVARDRDGETLCRSVYVFAGGPSPRCADVMGRIFSTPDGFSLSIRSIRFKAPERAVARASTVTIAETGAAQRFPHTTFQLERRDGVWRVVFVT